MLLTCPRCTQTLEVDDSLNGHFVQCGACTETFMADGIRVALVPERAPAAVLAAPAAQAVSDSFSQLSEYGRDRDDEPLTVRDVRRELRQDRAEDKSNSYGITSLILGIGCLFLEIVPALARNEFVERDLSIIRLLIIPLSIVGFILAICGLNSDKGKGFAVAGAVLNLLWVLAVIYVVFLHIAATAAANRALKSAANKNDIQLFDDEPPAAKRKKPLPDPEPDIPIFEPQPAPKWKVEPAPDSAAVREAIRQAIASAHADRKIRIGRREAAIANNKALAAKHGRDVEAYQAEKEKYDTVLKTWQGAKREADAVRRLNFSAKIQANIDAAETTGAVNALRERLQQWYRDIVKEFPGTAAAKEAGNRLAGKKLMAVTAPDTGVEPTEPRVPPMPTFASEGGPIPDVNEEETERRVRSKGR